MELARAERIDLADFLAGLTAEQWDAPSLCTQWRVRDVVTHMIGYEDLSRAEFYSRVAKAGFNPNKANANRVAELAGRTPQELLAMVRAAQTPGVLTSGSAAGSPCWTASSINKTSGARWGCRVRFPATG